MSRIRYLTIALVALIACANSLLNGFVLDDPAVIERNPHVVGHAFGRIFVSPYHTGPDHPVRTGLYRPLTTATFALNHLVGGLHPFGYHAVNVLLHAAVAVLVAAVATAAGLGASGALAAGLIFALHPVHSEAIANVAGRAELLSALFFLLALLAWARGDASTAPSRRVASAATAAALAFLAMLAKEHAVVFPAVAIAWSLALGARRRELPLHGAIVALPAAALLGLRAALLGSLALPAGAVTPIENPAFGLPLAERWSTAAAAGSRYLGLLIFPRELSPDYSYAATIPVRSLAEPAAALGLVAALAALGATAWLWRRKPAAGFALALGLATFAPVSNVAFPIGTLIAERLLYLPSVGFCLLGGLLWGALAPRLGKVARTAIVLSVLGISATRLAWANSAWRDEYSLWSRAYAVAPRSVRVLGNLAVEYQGRGRTAEAKRLLEDAAAIAPELSPIRVNLAAVRLAEGDLAGAEREVRDVLSRDPRDALAWLQLAVIRETARDLSGAEDALRSALAARPGLLAARLRLAAVLAREGAVEKARLELDEARRLAPESPEVERAARTLGLR